MASLASLRVPVTVVTGSLGAGKTTFLKRVLLERHGLRIAVIENELADEIGIESLILKDGVGGRIADGFFELANGCLCCSMKDGLVDTLQRIMQYKERFDMVLVETSGMADPGPVAAMFWTDDVGEEAMTGLVLDGVLAIVDAANFEQSLAYPREDGSVNETARQVAFADRVIVNKVDLVCAEKLAAVTMAIAGINCTARVVTSELCKAVRDLFEVHPLQLQLAEGASDAARDEEALGALVFIGEGLVPVLPALQSSLETFCLAL